MFTTKSASGVHFVVGAQRAGSERWYLRCSGGCDWTAETDEGEAAAERLAESHVNPIDELDLGTRLLRVRNAQRRREGQPELQSLF